MVDVSRLDADDALRLIHPLPICVRQHSSRFSRLIVGESLMRFRRREPLLSVLLDTGLHLLDLVRERLPNNVYDLQDAVRDKYVSRPTV